MWKPTQGKAMWFIGALIVQLATTVYFYFNAHKLEFIFYALFANITDKAFVKDKKAEHKSPCGHRECHTAAQLTSVWPDYTNAILPNSKNESAVKKLNKNYNKTIKIKSDIPLSCKQSAQKPK